MGLNHNILTLARSMVSAAKAANLSLLSLLDSEAEAGPPPPVLEPTLFWKSMSQTESLLQLMKSFDSYNNITLHSQYNKHKNKETNQY